MRHTANSTCGGVMKTRYLLSAVILGLLPFASAPASASVAGMTQSAITLTENTDRDSGSARGGGGAVRVNRSARQPNSAVNVNRNVRVNRNVNVQRNVNRNVNVNRGLYRGTLRLPRRPLGASAQLLVAGRRRDRRRRSAGHGRGEHSGVGRSGAGTRLLLVLHRPEPAAGLLGPVPVTTRDCTKAKTPPRGGVFVLRAIAARAN